MKKVWIPLTAIVLAVLGFILNGYCDNIFSAGEHALGYFASGRFAVGVFSSGLFSVGIFSAGLFSVGIFSLSVFNLALYGAGVFIIAWKKQRPQVEIAQKEDEQNISG